MRVFTPVYRLLLDEVPGRQSPRQLSWSRRARSSLSPTFLVSWGSVLTGPRSPSLSSHVTGARWGLGTQDTAVLTEHECLWTAFPRCGEFKPSFIPSEQRSAANEKEVAFQNAPTVLSTSCKFFLNSHNKAMRWILCPC